MLIIVSASHSGNKWKEIWLQTVKLLTRNFGHKLKEKWRHFDENPSLYKIPCDLELGFARTQGVTSVR